LEQAQRPAASPGEPGLLDEAGKMLGELRGLAHDSFQLLALEVQLACSRFAVMVGLALAAAALFATTWLGLVAAGVFYLIELGASTVAALLAVAGINLAAGVVCTILMRREGREMPFASTLRSILGR
jgi:hypothetical protein